MASRQSLAALAVLMLLSGCAIPAMPWDAPRPNASIVKPSPQLPPPQDATAEFAAIAGKIPKEYTVSYDMEINRTGLPPEKANATSYAVEGKYRLDIAPGAGNGIRHYQKGDDGFACELQKGGDWVCSVTSEKQDYANKPLIENLAGLGNYTVAKDASMTFAGVGSSCFDLMEKMNFSRKAKYCIAQDGMPLYAIGNVLGLGKGAFDGMIRASEYRQAASDSDFELPKTEGGFLADPFANQTPRNISDRIGDGQFRLLDQWAYPLKIYVISSGLSDSVLITKGEFHMLADAGNFEATDSFLSGMNITRINVLVATRDYAGAVGGISRVLDRYKVDEYWDNGVPPASTGLADALAKIKGMNITIKHPSLSDRMIFSGLEFSVLNPAKQRLLGNPDIDSVVMKVSMGRFCVLLLNPTVQERESALLSTGEDLRCEVLTYFKHGEGRPEASVLMNNVAPKDVVISVGPNNLGLPMETTLTRLAISGARVWRTDERGTVRITNDGFAPYTIESRKSPSSPWVGYS